MILSSALAIGIAIPACAQQGQYQVNSLPFDLPGFNAAGGLATYSPVRAVDSDTLTLRGDDGSTFVFALNAKTIFCHGVQRASDWSYLKDVRKKNSVTVLTDDSANDTALIVWDLPPTLGLVNGKFVFTLPAMCQ